MCSESARFFCSRSLYSTIFFSRFRSNGHFFHAVTRLTRARGGFTPYKYKNIVQRKNFYSARCQRGFPDLWELKTDGRKKKVTSYSRKGVARSRPIECNNVSGVTAADRVVRKGKNVD